MEHVMYIHSTEHIQGCTKEFPKIRRYSSQLLKIDLYCLQSHVFIKLLTYLIPLHGNDENS